MNVAELIEALQGMPQDLPVAYRCYSEHCLLQPDDLMMARLGAARDDGWVHDCRPDKPSVVYLVFPGN